ncbi:MAG: histidine kinase [Ferruginibacter sp.]
MDEEKILILAIIGALVTIILCLAVLAFIVIFQRKKVQHFAEANRHKEELLRTQLEIQEQTLKTISEEIHDNVGQVLSLVKLNLGTVDNPEDPKIRDTKALVSKAINDLRNLSRSMHSDIIAESGLQVSLQNELAIIENTRQFLTGLQVNGIPYRLDKQKEMVIFRIAQEALHNAIKYSKAKNICVDIHYSPAAFSLLVKDDGVGFGGNTGSGIGFKSMQNRARIIGAELLVESSPGNGTEVKLLLPLVNEKL